MKGQTSLLLLLFMLTGQVLIGQVRIAGPDKLHCYTDPAVMLTPDSGYLSYTWSPSTYLSDSSIQNPLASPLGTTTYTLTVFDGVSYFTDEVTVYSQTGSSADIIENNDTTVCYNTEVHLTTQFSDSVRWFDNFTSTSSINDTFSFSVEANHVVSLRVKDVYGCSLSDNVTVLGIGPEVDVNILGGSCSDGTGDVEVVETNGINGPFSISWSDGDTSFSRNGITIGSYSYTVTDNVGCSSNGNVYIGNSLNSIDLSVSDDILCAADTAQVNIGGNGSSIYTYQNDIFTVGMDNAYATSNSVYPAVFGNFFRSAKHQLLFRASELIAVGMTAGNISAMSFDVAQLAGTSRYCNFQISMHHTSLTEAPDTVIANGTTVFQPSTIYINTNWNNLVFDAPFYWDGVSNLLVDVCFDMTSITNAGDPLCDNIFTANSSNRYTTTPFLSVVASRSDITPQCDTTGFGIRSSSRPNVRFYHTILADSIIIDQLNWSNTKGLSDSNVLDPMVYPDTTTTYVLEIMDTAGCLYRDSLTIKVGDIEAQPSTVPAMVPCGEEDVELSANVTSTYPVVNYTWTGLDDLRPASGSATMTGTLPLSADSAFVQLVTSDFLGCINVSSFSVLRQPNCLSYITGLVFDDKDSNCVYDNMDEPLAGVLVNYSSGLQTFTDLSGHYNIQLNDTGQLLIQINVPNGFHDVCSSAASKTINISKFDSKRQLDDAGFVYDTVHVVNGINSPNGVDIMVYPDPANEVLNVRADRMIYSLKVIDLMGRSVYSGQVNDRSFMLPTNELAIGSYILVLTDEARNITTHRFSVSH